MAPIRLHPRARTPILPEATIEFTVRLLARIQSPVSGGSTAATSWCCHHGVSVSIETTLQPSTLLHRTEAVLPLHRPAMVYYIYIYDPGSAVPPPPPPPMVPPHPLWCGVVVGCFPPPSVVWCGVVVGCFPPPRGVVWFGCALWWFPPLPPLWRGLGGSPLHVWICLGCLANPCS